MNQVLENIMNFINNNNWVYLIPTLLVALILIFSILLGMKRGGVKSTHKFIIMGICLATSIGLFYLLTQNNGAMLYSVSSSVLGMFNMTFENLTHVKPTSNDMYGVIYPIVLNLVTTKLGGPENMAIEIYSQIDVWAQMGYKFVTFLLCTIIFTLLSIFLNIFDWIFFRKRKRIRKFKKINKNKRYNNHSLVGGFVGGLHGLTSSLILLSFIGFTFFALGSGERTNDKLSFKDPTMSNIYEVTNFTSKLGDSGLLKFLNKYKDDNNMPFYLFFANEIFSGNAKDYDGNEYKVYASNEMRSYTLLARDLMDVLAKHGGQELSIEILTNKNPDQTFEVLNNLFTDENFKNDLISIIDKYQATEYLKNITKVSISMVGKYYEEIFTKLSTTPDKYISMFDAIFSNELDPYYIAVEDIVTYEDAKWLLKGVLNTVPNILEILEFTRNNKELQTSSPKLYSLNIVNYSLEAFNELVPALNELTMFKELPADTREVKLSKIDKMNKLYDRCVDFAFNIVKNKLGKPINNPYIGKNIKWNQEFFNLTSAVSDVTSLTNEVIDYNNDNINLSALEVVNDIFSKNYANKVVIDNAYNGLADKASKFESVRILLDSEFFYTTYESLLSKITKTQVQIPRNINWVSTESSQGELTKSLSILREILAEETLKPYLKDPKLTDLNTLKEMVLKLESPYKDTTLLEYMFESDVLYYTSSAIMSNMKLSTFQMVVPDSCKEDINGVMVTKKADLVNTFKVLPTILKEIEDLNAVKTDPLSLVEVASKATVKDSVINSDILTATMSQTVYNMTTTNPNISKMLVIPAHLSLDGTDPNALNKWMGNNGELDKMLSTLPLIDIKALINNDKNAIVKVLNCSEADFNTLIGSDVLYFTINNLITTLDNPNFTIFVPNESVEVFTSPVQLLTNNTTNEVKVIKKSELYKMVHGASKIISVGQNNEFVFDFNAIIKFKDDILASNILYASVSNKLIELGQDKLDPNGQVISKKFIYIPSTLANADLHVISTTPWRTNKELEKVLETFNVLELDINNLINGKFNVDELTSKILSLDEVYEPAKKSKIEVLYESSIISLTLSETLINEPSIQGRITIPETCKEKMAISDELIIKGSEWYNLINGVKKAFGLTSQSNIMNEFKDFTKLISNFFNSVDYNVRKVSLFNSLILEDTMINNIILELDKLAINDIVIPNMMRENNNKLWYMDRTDPNNYKDGELGNLLDILYATEVGKVFGQPNFNEAFVNALTLDKIIFTQSDSLLPNSKDILAAKKEKQKLLLGSHILNATIINKITSTNAISIPNNYKFTDIKTEYNSNNIWVSSQELYHMFNSINELKIDIVGNSINFDINIILNNTYNMVNICNSKLIHFTLSDKLLKTPKFYFAASDVDKEGYISSTELDYLIGSVKVLANGSKFDVDNIKINSIFDDNYEKNIGNLFKSNTLQLTIINIINDTFSSNNAFIIPKELSFTKPEDKLVDMSDPNLGRYLYNPANDKFGTNELKHIFDIIKALGLGNAIDSGAKIELKLNTFIKNSANTEAENILAQDRQDKIFNSLLFSTAFVKAINDIKLTIPTHLAEEYKLINTKEINYLDTDWNKNNEVRKLIDAIQSLNISIGVDNTIKVDINEYLKLLSSETIKTCYSSSIMYLTLSKTLLSAIANTMIVDAKDYIVDVNLYNEKVLNVNEFEALILGIKALGFTSVDSNVLVPSVDQVEVLCKSNTLRNTVSNKILLALKEVVSNDIVVTTFKKLDTTNYAPSSENYVSFNTVDIIAFIKVLNSQGTSSTNNNNFGFKIEKFEDIKGLNDTIFESKIAISVINDFILNGSTTVGPMVITYKELFVKDMQTKKPDYTIGKMDVTSVKVDSATKLLNQEYITQADLKLFKGSSQTV